MTDREKITDKIRKLFALSKSSNEHEAALALKNANELLMKYNIDMMDVSATLSDIVESDVMSGKKFMVWKTTMLQSVMKFNNCEIIKDHKGIEKTIKAMGKKQNIEVSMAMYDYLIATIDRAIKADRYISDKHSFHVGFARAIKVKVGEIIVERQKEKSEFNTACSALVVQEKNAVTKYMKDAYKNLKTTTLKSSYRNSASYNSGYVKGQSTSLNGQIG